MAPRTGQRRWEKLLGVADAEVRRLRAALPRAVRTEAEGLPVTYEGRPSREIIEAGTPADTLGLFLGVAMPYSEEGTTDVPAQVILFLDNLWHFANQDLRVFRDEVRRTYLHELGHYLGLDESALEERDLD